MAYVIGIDPSITATGVCLLRDNGPPKLLTVTAGSNPSRSLAKRLHHLGVALATASLPTGTTPLLAAIETPISPLALSKSRGGAGYNNNVMAYGVCYEMLGKFRIPYVEVTPHQRAMIATGKGNSNKDKVVDAWNGLMIEHDSIKIDHNQIDAFFIAMAAAERYAIDGIRKFAPHCGWLNLDDRIYDMLEGLEIHAP